MISLALQKQGLGYNSETGEIIDMVSHGIIDPAKVVINSLIYGSSIASIMLSTDCAVLHHDD